MGVEYWQQQLNVHSQDMAAGSAGDQGDGQEHTVGGRLIGAVAEVFSRGRNDSGEQAVRAAAAHDSIANIVADTASMLPGVKWAVAGGLRAAILIDPAAGWEENVQGFGKNFLEGVALHGVTKLSGELTGQRAAGVSLSRSLLAESVGNFAFGAGLGVVKAGFAPESWYDQQGRFSLTCGLWHMGKAGGIGGAINVPAGMIASRLGRGAVSALGEGQVSSRLASVVSGVTAGFAGGAVFGGVESASSRGSFSDILSGMGRGGLAGAATGGLVGSFARVELPQQSRSSVSDRLAGSRLVGAQEKRLSRMAPSTVDSVLHPGTLEQGVASIGDRSAETTVRRLSQPSEHVVDEALFRRLNVSLRPERSLEERLAQLGGYQKVLLEQQVPRAGADKLVGQYKSFEDFLSRGVKVERHNARAYQVGANQIVIPEKYAASLDEVLKLRILASRQADLFADGSAEVIKGTVARAKLQEHPLKNRAHPVDLLPYIEELPDRTLAKRILILGEPNAQDPWHRQTYKPDFVSQATAGPDGTVTFYQQDRDLFARQTAYHEAGGHLLKYKVKLESELFDRSANVEKDGFYTSEYARRDHDENWAEHMARLLHPDAHAFLETAQAAPIRSAIMARALVKALAYVPQESQSPYQTVLGERVRYIQEEVLPKAQSRLVIALEKGSSEQKADAARLLGYLGDENHVELLKAVAQQSKDPVLSRAAFEGAWGKVFRGRETWTGYNETKSVSPDDARVDFLLEMAAPGSVNRPLAIDVLSRVGGKRAQQYHQLLTLSEFKGNKFNLALTLMEQIPEASGKETAFREALKLTGSDAKVRSNLAIRALWRAPELTRQAIDVLASDGLPSSEYYLRKYTHNSNPEIAESARQGLKKIAGEVKFATLTSRLATGDETSRLEAIRQMGSSKDMRVVRPLLETFASGTNAERMAAFRALVDNYPPNLTKFEASAMMRDDPKYKNLLRPVVERKLVVQ